MLAKVSKINPFPVIKEFEEEIRTLKSERENSIKEIREPTYEAYEVIS